MTSEIHGPPSWDDQKASALMGTVVLVGITYVSPDRNSKKQIQCFGVVTQTLKDKGVEIECHGQRWNGQKIWLPPDLTFFDVAKEGQYRLREPGEILTDPAFITSCTIYMSAN